MVKIPLSDLESGISVCQKTGIHKLQNGCFSTSHSCRIYMICSMIVMCYFLVAIQESNQRRWHRGGVRAALPRVKYTLPYVPHPWRIVGRCFLLPTRLESDLRRGPGGGLGGSDGSAACGGLSDLSEWQRSADAKVFQHRRQMSGTATGRAAQSWGRSVGIGKQYRKTLRSAPPPAAFFGSFLVRTQEMNTWQVLEQNYRTTMESAEVRGFQRFFYRISGARPNWAMGFFSQLPRK